MKINQENVASLVQKVRHSSNSRYDRLKNQWRLEAEESYINPSRYLHKSMLTSKDLNKDLELTRSKQGTGVVLFDYQLDRPDYSLMQQCSEHRFNYFDSLKVQNSTRNQNKNFVIFDKMLPRGGERRNGSRQDHFTEEDR